MDIIFLTAIDSAVSATCEPPSSCTVFTVVKDSLVFFRDNDDYIHSDSYYWVDPGSETTYEAIWIGRENYVQQGITRWDWPMTPTDYHVYAPIPTRSANLFRGGYTSYPIHVFRNCASVEKVIE